ncbi:hypothetical protein INT43_006423 [Umbelopsis isabellina]|uniref:Squalene cyclase N-terminal domain-containing protein n=1 Tax=Mortierella isabellina TaxID=91625 RepID=A0A8H7PZQ1_MORIS|nr:hypothetical protein INT43_006423 [Umbelopsis isabellina]
MIQFEKYPSAVIDSVEPPAFSDLVRWRLKVKHGAQTWHYLQSEEELRQWPPTRWEKYFLDLPFNDGGWGIHTQGISTVFGTALNYVVLRTLGLSADHRALIKARAKLHQLGGAAAIPA